MGTGVDEEEEAITVRFIAGPENSDTVKTNRYHVSAVFFQQPMFEGILHQLGARLHAELFHDRVFVKGHGTRADMNEVGDFLHRVAFREELEHFTLAHGELLLPDLTARRRKTPRGTPLVTSGVM